MIRWAIFPHARSAGNCELKMLPDAARSCQALSKAARMACFASGSKDFPIWWMLPMALPRVLAFQAGAQPVSQPPTPVNRPAIGDVTILRLFTNCVCSKLITSRKMSGAAARTLRGRTRPMPRFILLPAAEAGIPDSLQSRDVSNSAQSSPWHGCSVLFGRSGAASFRAGECHCGKCFVEVRASLSSPGRELPSCLMNPKG
jgi:hypothetical protein